MVVNLADAGVVAPKITLFTNPTTVGFTDIVPVPVGLIFIDCNVDNSTCPLAPNELTVAVLGVTKPIRVLLILPVVLGLIDIVPVPVGDMDTC